MARFAEYVEADPTGEWMSTVDNLVDSVLDFIPGSFTLRGFRDIAIDATFAVPITQCSGYAHVVFRAVCTVACEAYRWEERLQEPPSAEEAGTVDPAFVKVLSTLPRRVPVGQPETIELDFDVQGHAVYPRTNEAINSVPVAVYGRPLTAGLAGQPRLSRSINVHEFFASLKKSARGRRNQEKQ